MEDPTRYMNGSSIPSSGSTTPTQAVNGSAINGNGHAVGPIQVDAQFWGDTVILVENTLFHIPTYLLCRDSQLFSTLFSLSPGSAVALPKLLEEAPIDINKSDPAITADDFRAFAKALTSTAHNPTPLTPDELTRALDLSNKWSFPTLSRSCLAQLCSGRDPLTSSLVLLPHARIRLGHTYRSPPVLLQAYVDQCLSLTPPDLPAYRAVVEESGPQAFLDLLEARRLVWAALRAEHPRRAAKEGTVWTNCERRPEWCHTNWLFRQALSKVLELEAGRKERGAPYADFDEAFVRALGEQMRLMGRTACGVCEKLTVERMSWFVDSETLFDIVKTAMALSGVEEQPPPVNGKGRGKGKPAGSAKASNGPQRTTAGYLWNVARGLPGEPTVEAAQHSDWQRFMNPENSGSQ